MWVVGRDGLAEAVMCVVLQETECRSCKKYVKGTLIFVLVKSKVYTTICTIKRHNTYI